MRSEAYHVGVDLGKMSDPAAIAVVRAIYKEPVIYEGVHLERMPLLSGYPAVIRRVREIMSHPLIEGGHLVVDETGVGEAVVDYMRHEKLRPIGVVINRDGTELRVRPGGFVVPKPDIIGALMLALQSERLKIASGLKLAKVLDAELQNYRMKTTPGGARTYEAWHESDHDDLVIALGLAVWNAARVKPRTEEVDDAVEYDPLGRI